MLELCPDPEVAAFERAAWHMRCILAARQRKDDGGARGAV